MIQAFSLIFIFFSKASPCGDMYNDVLKVVIWPILWGKKNQFGQIRGPEAPKCVRID